MKRQSSQTRPTRHHLTPNEKAEILKEQRHSGLSLLAFAQKRGLCYSSLLRWRCREDSRGKVLGPSDTAADPRFVPVKVEGEVSEEPYVLSWATGRSLKIPRQFETDSLRRLLRVLEGVR